MSLFRRKRVDVMPPEVSQTIRSFRTIIVCGTGREGQMVHHLKLIRHELDKLIEYCEDAARQRTKGGV